MVLDLKHVRASKKKWTAAIVVVILIGVYIFLPTRRPPKFAHSGTGIFYVGTTNVSGVGIRAVFRAQNSLEDDIDLVPHWIWLRSRVSTNQTRIATVETNAIRVWARSEKTFLISPPTNAATWGVSVKLYRLRSLPVRILLAAGRRLGLAHQTSWTLELSSDEVASDK